MRVFYGMDDLQGLKRPVVTVGSFDGVHLGHKALLNATVSLASRKQVDSVAVTFWPHPRKILKPDGRTWLLTNLDEKLWLLGQAGIDAAVVVPFTTEFSRLGYSEFIEKIILQRVGASAMVVGYDHKFGHDKQGDYGLLTDTLGSRGLEVVKVPEFRNAGNNVSSTEARKAVAQGDMSLAGFILGHPYILSGTAAPDGTVSIPDPDKLLPPPGEYPVTVWQAGQEFPAKLTVTPATELFISGLPPSPEATQARILFL
ncbi:MAG: FAD synthetase [Alistipes sp.]|nr:FAD synthetase [Alistipes sp.]